MRSEWNRASDCVRASEWEVSHKPRVGKNIIMALKFCFFFSFALSSFGLSAFFPHHIFDFTTIATIVRACVCVSMRINFSFEENERNKNGDEIVSFQSSVGFCAHLVGPRARKRVTKSQRRSLIFRRRFSMCCDEIRNDCESARNFQFSVWNFMFFSSLRLKFANLLITFLFSALASDEKIHSCAHTHADFFHQINAFVTFLWFYLLLFA